MICAVLAFILISFGDALHLQKRISMGGDVDMGDYPSVVAIRNRKTQEYICVGSIIDAEWVLTSAECVVFYPSWELEIMAGTISKTEPSSYTQFREVTDYKYHEDFDMSGTHPNDIAVLKLSSPLDLSSELVKATTLANADDYNWYWSHCKLAGWGGNEETCENHHENCEMWGKWGECDNNPKYMRVYCRKACKLCDLSLNPEGSDYLRDGEQTILPRQECTKGRLPLHSMNKQSYCGMSDNYSQGGCVNGDKGAPLLCLHKDNRYYQLGVMSWANKECTGGLPTVYVAVNKYIDWINEKTGLNL